MLFKFNWHNAFELCVLLPGFTIHLFLFLGFILLYEHIQFIHLPGKGHLSVCSVL